MSTNNPPPTYGDAAAGMLQRAQHGGPGLHTETEEPATPQPNWVTAVESVLKAAEAWEQQMRPGGSYVVDQQLRDAIHELRQAWQ